MTEEQKLAEDAAAHLASQRNLIALKCGEETAWIVDQAIAALRREPAPTSTCPLCKGTGQRDVVSFVDSSKTVKNSCSVCKGKGVLPSDREPATEAVLEMAAHAIGELPGGDEERDRALDDAMTAVRALKGKGASPDATLARALKNEAAFHCLLHHCQRALAMPGPHTFDRELSDGVHAAIAISHGEKTPMKLHFDNDWVKRTTAADPDVDIEAGPDIALKGKRDQAETQLAGCRRIIDEMGVELRKAQEELAALRADAAIKP